MNSCTSILTWVKDGCDPSVINQDFVRNVKHWTGEKTGGLAHNEKFQTDECERLLQELRNKTSPLILKDVEKVSSVEDQTLDTQDVCMSETSHCNISDLLAESGSDDEMNYGPHSSNIVVTENSGFYFNIKEEKSVAKVFGDEVYRKSLTFENKDHIMEIMAKEILEQRVVMELGRKLSSLRNFFLIL
jgi:hypothetical protein